MLSVGIDNVPITVAKMTGTIVPLNEVRERIGPASNAMFFSDFSAVSTEQIKLSPKGEPGGFTFSPNPLSIARFVNDHYAAKKEPQRLPYAGLPNQATIERVLNKDDTMWDAHLSGAPRRLAQQHGQGESLSTPYLNEGTEVRAREHTHTHTYTHTHTHTHTCTHMHTHTCTHTHAHSCWRTTVVLIGRTTQQQWISRNLPTKITSHS